MNFAKFERQENKTFISRFQPKHTPKIEDETVKDAFIHTLDEEDQQQQDDDGLIDTANGYVSLTHSRQPSSNTHTPTSSTSSSRYQRLKSIVVKYSRFIGPGLMVSVSYMDPGNYSTAVAAGSSHKFKLLFSILLSNILAVFLQILCAKLGSVTGLDLAQNCRKHLPKKLNIGIYVLAEIAIIATDLAEVIGTAISLNILFGLPLLVGVVLTIIDVLIVLMAYKPNGDMKIIRIFEAFVAILVIMTVICFTIELATVEFSVKEVFRGFLPSKEIVEGDGLYLSLAILGATVMPHSLYLGSGLVQSRLKEYDVKMGNYIPPIDEDDEIDHKGESFYRPSKNAIKETMHYTISELVVSLFTVALFVNSAILIVSGSTLNGVKDTDLFSIHDLLSDHLSKFAGLIFVLALLFSGQSAGIVCTLSGQMISEGFLQWSIPPTLRRLITRAVAITPCLILVLVAGRSGLSDALNASQVVLSILLPFVSAPLLWLTSSKKIMRVRTDNRCFEENSRNHYEMMNLTDDVDDSIIMEQDVGVDDMVEYEDMSNSKITNFFAVLIWCFISGLNFFLIFSFAMGKDVNF